MRGLFIVLALAPLALAFQGGEERASRHVKLLAPYVDDMTFLVAHVDLSRVKLDAISQWMAEFGIEKKDSALARIDAANLHEAIARAGGKDFYFLMNWSETLNDFLIVVPCGQDEDAAKIRKIMELAPGIEAKSKDAVIVAGTKAAMRAREDFKPRPTPGLARAFANLVETALRVVVMPPPVLLKAQLELMPTLPKEIGGGSTTILGKGILWAALSVDLGATRKARLVVQSQDAKAAQDLSHLVSRTLDFLAESGAAQSIYPDFRKLTPLLSPKADGDKLTLTLNDKDLSAVLSPVIAKAQAQAKIKQSMSNLQSIGVAMHRFHTANKSLPAAAIYGKDGKPLLSWRVHVLPFLDQEALYKQFHLDEPWDSEHNKKLITKMPAVYCSPYLQPENGRTTYLVLVGPGTTFEGNKGMSAQQVTDGTSNTVMAVEVVDSRAVFWTQPEEYKIDAKDPSAGLIRQGADHAVLLYVDASARLMDRKVDPNVWRAVYTPSGGEVVQFDGDGHPTLLGPRK